MPAKSTRTLKGDAAFFDALEAGHSVVIACVVAGYTRSCVYEWFRRDLAFAATWREASARALEAEADRRLLDRYKRPVYAHGEIVGYRLTCPDPLLFERYTALRERVERARLNDAFPATEPVVRAPAAAPNPSPRAGVLRRLQRWLGIGSHPARGAQ